METYSFGEWIKARRKVLRLTQRELAATSYCSTAMIKKIEADERQPSVELAQALAVTLQIPAERHGRFVEIARGERPLDQLRIAPREVNLVPQSPGSLNVPALPTPATPFVGRTAELDDIMFKLRQPACRLLTLLGPGGIGKTRIALEAARRLQTDFAAGTVFVDLVAVTDPSFIADRIAHALNLTLPGPADRHLPRVLRQRQMLILLDNCEQMVDGDGVEWLSTLLATAPDITLLTTSRERLQLAEEWVCAVAGMGAAEELFGQTAVRVTPDFDRQVEATSVRHICQLVENFPLAVELAAGWTPYLSCIQIAEQIQKGLGILATTVRNVPARHRSMEAVFDASWELLTETERAVLMRLSVLRGGWRAEEATAVAGADLFLLRSLAEKSLVRVGENERFSLHELTRQYAADQLRAAEIERETQQQHADIFFAIAQRFSQVKATREGPAFFKHMREELGNIRAALRWLLDMEQGKRALQFAALLGDFWLWGGQRVEGVYWLEEILAHSAQEDGLNQCEALLGLIPLLAFIGREQDALAYINRAKEIAYRLEDPFLTIRILVITSQYLADRDEAKAALEEALALFDSLEEESSFIGAAYALYGDLLRETGHYAAAREYYRKTDEIERRYGISMFGSSAGNIGRLALQEGDLPEAYTLISDHVQTVRRLQNPKGLADWLVRIGEVETHNGLWDAAEAHFQECFQLMEEMGDWRGQADVSA